MTPTQVENVQQDIERVLRRHGVWYTVTHDKRPDLKSVTISDIVLRVTETDK
jgi:hypothetical protein